MENQKLLYDGWDLYNAKCKNYENGVKKYIIFNKPIFNPKNLKSERRKRKDFSKLKNLQRSDSLKRAKEKIFDIVSLNQFQYFVTLTYSKEKVNRYDIEETTTKLKNWLSNMTRRYNCSYVLIPEFHKDGAIHYHALMNGDFNLVDSGLSTNKGATIYNLKNWSYGFSTVIGVYENGNILAKYITKYITKDLVKIFGKYYWSSRSLRKEVPVDYYNVDFKEVNAKIHCITGTNLKVKYFDDYN